MATTAPKPNLTTTKPQSIQTSSQSCQMEPPKRLTTASSF